MTDIVNEYPACGGCNQRIEPDVCWCGEGLKMHTHEHSFVPLGCTCGFADKDPYEVVEDIVETVPVSP